MTPTNPPHILNTLTATKEIHRGTDNLNRLPLTPTEAANLQQLVDAVLSFTAYYLRVEKANCRPSQLDALAALTHLNNELEKQYDVPHPAA